MKQFLLFLVLMLTLASCTKVIDIKLNDAEATYVVEGYLTEGESTHHLKLTKTLALDQPSAYPQVTDATISITDDLGFAATYNMVAPGEYELSNYQAHPNRTYTLTIQVGSKQFKSIQRMPNAVQIDTVQSFPFAFGPSSFVALIPVRMDPAGESNYYQFNMIKAGKPIKGIFIQSDQYNDGNQMMEPIFAEDIQQGDTIDIEMYCIDRSIYDYFYTLVLNQQGAQPANPQSNLTGGCLGYFAVRTKEHRTVIVP